ncbi:hypothetical protein LUX01_10990 [Streptomyces sudanensis]|uniref:hypothetical protein n=1 Tax=Streptomyces sudanensis TaxID=436397 RepID=UPI0020CCCC9E|nr:hypothetical protein [Streptomyces sudanensis]MCP9987136.1 hypothetical protein [Streptomyces sudanensis]
MNLAIFLIGAITAEVLASPLIWMLVLLFGAVMLVGRIARKERERRKQGKNRRNSPLMELVLLGVLVPRIFEVASRVGLLSISLVIVFALAVLVALKGFRTVPADHVGIVYRAHGSSHPTFPNVTPHNTRGVLARTLRPGQRCWLFPLLYHVKYVPRVRVEENNIGLVTAKEGKVRPAGRSLAARGV